MRNITRSAALIAFGLLATAPPARAEDDKPTPEQRARIEAALRQMGFERWGEIEREDGGRAWEVEDARGPDGRKHELRLSSEDLREASRRADD